MKNTRLLIIMLIVLYTLPIVSAEKSEYWEKDCSKGHCSQVFYSTQKYWNNSNKWEEINESWTDIGCMNGYQFCVIDNLNNYEVHVKQTLNSPLSIVVITPDNQDYIYYKPDRLEDQGGNSRTINPKIATIQGNELIYKDVFLNADLVLRYLPHFLKEELILYAPPFQVIGNLTFVTKTSSSFTDIRINRTIDFYKNGKVKAIIPYPEESNINKNMGLGTNANGEISVTVEYDNYDFKQGALIIDPSTTLDFNQIIRDAEATKTHKTSPPPFLYGVLSTSTPIKIGLDGCDTNNITHRGGIDWDVGSIPQNVQVTEAKAQYTISAVDDDDSTLRHTNITFHAINLSSITASQFNELDGEDYGFITALVASTQRNLTFTQSGRDGIESAINSDFIFSYGMSNNDSLGSVPACPTQDTTRTGVVASESGTASFRPVLYLTYGYVPNWTEPNVDPASPQVFNGSNIANFTIKVQDIDADLASVILSINGTNFTATDGLGDTPLLSLYNVTINNTIFTIAGNYSYKWFMTDDLGLSNETDTYYYILTSANRPFLSRFLHPEGRYLLSNDQSGLIKIKGLLSRFLGFFRNLL